MARAKFDGIIEAVRYLPSGKIDSVRIYERRGSVWSDNILLRRNELVDKIEKGNKFATGHRKEYLGSLFEIRQPVKQVKGCIVSEGQFGEKDNLFNVPVF